MKTVLIALDYNPTAQKVAEMGILLAKKMKADVILLHVITDIEYYTLTGNITSMSVPGFMEIVPMQLNSPRDLKKSVQQFLDKTKKHLGYKKITTLIKDGDLSNTILTTAKKSKADIIVVGSHSRRWLEKIVMGSITEKVLNNTSIPLFIIPTKKQK